MRVPGLLPTGPWIRLPLCTVTLGLVACAGETTSPDAARVQPGTQTLAAVSDRIDKHFGQIKDRLSGSAYRAIFGWPTMSRRSNHGLTLPLGRGLGAKPRDGADVLVNDRSQIGIGQSETTIADHGGTLVVGFNDAAGFYDPDIGVSGWAVSRNKGKSFVDGDGLPNIPTPGFVHLGDPGLAVGNNGVFYYSDICIVFPNEPFDFAHPFTSGVCVTRGRRQGQTIAWERPVFAAAAPGLESFLDKPFIATDRQGEDVYVSYGSFDFEGDVFLGVPIKVVASHDGGRSFGQPVVAGPFVGFFQSGSEPAVGPNGELYVAWVRYPSSTEGEVVVAKSTDGGQAFGGPVQVATFFPVNTEVPGYNRGFINDFPRIDVARSGPYRGEVYVSFHDATRSLADVLVTHSPDGLRWHQPVLVNDDLTDYQFWPVVAVEPGGNVDVVWYDRRLNPGTAITNVFWSQSTDNGNTFRPNVRVTDVSSNWAAAVTDIIPNFGDYIDVSAGGNRTFATWGDGRLGDPDVFFSELRGVGKAPTFAQR